MTEFEHIRYDVERHVSTITIDRPEVLNAFTQLTLDEIERGLDLAEADEDVAVIVITGSGERAFCAGGDVTWEAEGGLEGVRYNLSSRFIGSDKPIIARVNGYAIGGGNHMQYFCDFTIAAEHAIFGQNGPRVGSPAAGHVVAHSARILGHKRAKEMWMLCRRYSAADMMGWGMVNSVVPMAELDAEVRRWADDLIGLSPTCLRLLKRTFEDEMSTMMEKDEKHFVRKFAPDYFDTGEQTEGVEAFQEKRQPDFSPWRSGSTGMG